MPEHKQKSNTPDALHTAGLINPLLLKRRNSTNSGGDYV